MHGCSSLFCSVEEVREEFKGKTVWEGMVHVFNVKRPKADRCFVWTSEVEGTNRRKFYAVLTIPPVNTALNAVRATIVADSK